MDTKQAGVAVDTPTEDSAQIVVPVLTDITDLENYVNAEAQAADAEIEAMFGKAAETGDYSPVVAEVKSLTRAYVRNSLLLVAAAQTAAEAQAAATAAQEAKAVTDNEWRTRPGFYL